MEDKLPGKKLVWKIEEGNEYRDGQWVQLDNQMESSAANSAAGGKNPHGSRRPTAKQLSPTSDTLSSLCPSIHCLLFVRSFTHSSQYHLTLQPFLPAGIFFQTVISKGK